MAVVCKYPDGSYVFIGDQLRKSVKGPIFEIMNVTLSIYGFKPITMYIHSAQTDFFQPPFGYSLLILPYQNMSLFYDSIFKYVKSVQIVKQCNTAQNVTQVARHKLPSVDM